MSKRKSIRTQLIPKKFDPLVAKLPEDVIEKRPLKFEHRDEHKMSVVLLDFMEPILEYGKTDDELNNLLKLATTAWNAALFPPDTLAKCVDEMFTNIPFWQRRPMKAAFMKMVRRKQELFADNRRMIIDYHLRNTKDGPHISVVSTVAE
ncbi:MAG: hypothetical protein WCL71_04275 [Deltaproteobacteria bacterium]